MTITMQWTFFWIAVGVMVGIPLICVLIALINPIEHIRKADFDRKALEENQFNRLHYVDQRAYLRRMRMYKRMLNKMGRDKE